MTDKILVGEFDVHLKGDTVDCTLPARFFMNYQKEHSVWGEFVPSGMTWSAGAEVEISSTNRLMPFPALLSGSILSSSSGALSLSAEITPMRQPIESAPATDLTEITFALLDSPVTGNRLRQDRSKPVMFRCGQFDIAVTELSDTHREIEKTLGPSPHRLSNSGTVKERNGFPFTSKLASEVLDTLHDALSFASGGWVGILLVQGTSIDGSAAYFRWGTTKMTDTSSHTGWYDPGHPEWLLSLCDGLLIAKSHEETWEPIRTALYWYIRSNTRGAGIDSSLILSQCALELLSWFVIVKKTAALTEQGYSQLSSASEKLRLTLTLLKIPWKIPVGLKNVTALQKNWRDVAEAIVQGRNYLVHPTQSRSGKRHAIQDYPWYELWIAAQWVLELVILRLLGYTDNYRNRTRLRDFDPVERVPWAQDS